MGEKVLFIGNSPFVFMGVNTFSRRDGSGEFSFLKLGNLKEVENYEFIVTRNNAHIADGLKIGDEVIPRFTIGTYQNRPSFTLTGLELVRSPVANK